MVAPDYVWVQELTDDLKELETDMIEYLNVACPASPERSARQVVVRLKKFIFRANVVKWGEATAHVFAIGEQITEQVSVFLLLSPLLP